MLPKALSQQESIKPQHVCMCKNHQSSSPVNSYTCYIWQWLKSLFFTTSFLATNSPPFLAPDRWPDVEFNSEANGGRFKLIGPPSSHRSFYRGM